MECGKYFDAVATQWDDMRAGFFPEAVRDAACARARLVPGQTAADVGAGTGFVTEALVARGLAVIALDANEAMLRQLQGKAFAAGAPGMPPVDCRVCPDAGLPLPDGAVDHAFANMYLHHTENPGLALREMARIVRPGGQVIVTDLDRHEHEFLLREHHDRWPGFDRADVARWMEEAGLADVRVEDAQGRCCAASACGNAAASISIFLASGTRRAQGRRA